MFIDVLVAMVMALILTLPLSMVNKTTVDLNQSVVRETQIMDVVEQEKKSVLQEGYIFGDKTVNNYEVHSALAGDVIEIDIKDPKTNSTLKYYTFKPGVQ